MADVKKLFKKLGKKVLKKILFSKVFIIVVICIIIFMILFSGLVYVTNLIEGVLEESNLKNVPYVASTYTNGVSISSQGLITQKTSQELWDTMIQNGSNVKKYLKSPEELEKMMKAEIVTQNPKIGKGDLDGIIEFKRRKTDKSIIDLKYVDEKTFNSYIDAYNANGDETALKYYTIDTNGNVLIAQWTKITETVEVSVDGSVSTSKTTVTYSMSSAMINYKSVVQKFTMPFDYLWALLITTNGKNFVLELADYVIEDSQIEITGAESYSKVTDDYTETTQIPVTVQETVKDPKTGENKTESKTEYKTQTTKTTTTTESNNVNADLTKANTWIIEYEKDEKGNVTSKPKVDKDSKERNFITILNKYPYTKQSLDSSALMLFEILERNTSTANMVDLTKYLLYMATGNYYGVKEYDFSIYDDNEFNAVGSSSASDLLIRYIHTWENSTSPPTNADGTKYIIESDGYGNPTVGYGVDIYNSGYLSLFQAAGYPTSIGGEVDKEFVDSLESKIIEDKTKGIKSSLSGINLTDYQLNALISRAYNCGSSGAIGVRNGKNFVQAYKAYWNQDKDDYFKDKNKNANFNHKLYTQYMNIPVTSKGVYSSGLERRRKSEWILFQTGYYDLLEEWHSDVSGGSIVEIAKSIHEYMEKNNYSYCVYGGNSYEECSKYKQSHGLNKTFEQSKTGYKHSCCATFVSWVLQEAGYISDSEHLDGANNLQALLKGKGYKVINSATDLQAGDILCYNHHVEIYAGNNTIYNAGSGNAIRSASPQKRTRSFSYALRAPK